MSESIEVTPENIVAACDKRCDQSHCAVAWPDGSCGRQKQGKLFPPLYAPAKQSPLAQVLPDDTEGDTAAEG